MRKSMWLAGAIASVALVGCAHQERKVKSDQALLGQLPMNEKQATFTAQHDVEVARANQQAAGQAKDQADSFRDIANSQLDSANSQLKAAKKGIVLGNKSGSAQTLQAAQANAAVAQKEVNAFKSKKDYADNLVSLREEQKNLADKQLDLAQNELSMTRVRTLQRHGLRPSENVATLTSQRDSLQGDIAGLQGKINGQQAKVNDSRQAWLENQHSYNVASRGTTPSIRAPEMPEQYQPKPVPGSPNTEQELQPYQPNPNPGAGQPNE